MARAHISPLSSGHDLTISDSFACYVTAEGVVLCAGETPENVLIAVRSVIPSGAPVDPGEIRTWSQDILEYVQTIAATLLPPDQPANA